MGYQDNDVEISIPRITRKAQKYIYATMYIYIHDTSIYTHILTKYITRKRFFDDIISL